MTQKNYWPHFIIALVSFAVLMGIWTLKMASQHPVQLDNSFMMKYQQVDANYYKIEADRKKFDKLYKVVFFNKKLQKGKNHIELQLLTKDGKPVNGAKVTILITRPYTTKYDKTIKAKFVDGKYVADVDIPLEGRWDVDIKIEKDGLVRYLKYRRSTRRVIPDNLKKHLI